MSAKKPAVANPPTTVVAKDADDGKGVLTSIGGSVSDDWNLVLVNQTSQTLWVKHSDEKKIEQQRDATLAALAGIAPKDELEAMIASQLLAAQNAAMECYRRAMLPEQTFEGRRENLTQANKLSRTFAALIEALDRHRGKGQQKVIVEHVHVHSGGQAIVGTIEPPGGGIRAKPDEQPHALTYQPVIEMPGANPKREAVPNTLDDQRALQDARRHIARRPKEK